jgi:glutamyl-tRNA reductase
VHLVKQQLPTFSEANVVLVGAGDTVQLILRYLKSHIVKPITLVNRSLDNASALMDEMGGHIYGLDRLGAAISRADVVFSATGSAVPIITKDIVVNAMRERAGRPVLMMDIAVPRDIDNAVTEVNDVNLYCIDDLKAIIEGNRQGREHAAIKAREMIYNKSAEYLKESQAYDHVAHTIRAYRGQIESLCHAELNKAKQRLLQGDEADQVLEMFARSFTNKLLHSPSIQLRQAGAEGRFELLRFAKELFAISDPEVELL